MARIILRLLVLSVVISITVGCNDKLPNRLTIAKNLLEPAPVEPVVPTRPDEAVIFKNDFCACQNSQPVIYGNCQSFCAARPSVEAKFYANFDVTEDISMTSLGSVQGWCQKPLTDSEGNVLDNQNPSCSLIVKDEDNQEFPLEVVLTPNANFLVSDISELQPNKVYMARLRENSSGAQSTAIQFYKIDPFNDSPYLGPLKIIPITQYSCVLRDLSEDENTGDLYYETAYRLHFYFTESFRPDPIAPDLINVFCHDIFMLGNNDDPVFPRLEESPGTISLWDAVNEPRFFDNNGNNVLDVNDQIISGAQSFGLNLPSSTNFFQPLSWAGSPAETTQQILGWYMIPWIDQNTFRSFCPNSSYYNSNNAIFKAMKDIIGVDTEALYIAEKSGELVTNNNGQTVLGPKDYILVRETDAKQAWFFLNNGIHTVPTDTNITNKTVMFYYPFDFVQPFIKKSSQRTYIVKGASQLNTANQPSNQSGNPNQGSLGSFPPHDKRVGCIPKLQ